MKKLRVLILVFYLAAACGPGYAPKPRGYFRIDLPEHEYRVFDTTFPYVFEYPVYSTIESDNSSLSEPFWINVRYDRFHAKLHLSYKVVRGNLPGYLEDARTLVNKHIPKANSITRREYSDPGNHVFGLLYEIRGPDAASSCQFYVTDSVSQFVRGALYFDLVPDNDSLAPVIEFLKTDIDHMISTFRWKTRSL